jgi:hypothetical protein
MGEFQSVYTHKKLDDGRRFHNVLRNVMAINRKLLDLQLTQEDKRVALGHFKEMEKSELTAIVGFAIKCFGEANKVFQLPDGQGIRWGGLIEAGPEEPGIVYVGYYLDPPHIAPAKRRRKLIFRGAKISELEAQARVFFS